MKRKFTSALLLFLCLPLYFWAQEPVEEPEAKQNPLTIDFGAKLKSRHVWNGWLSCNAWNIQPDLTISAYGLFFNAWAYTALDHTLSSEIDLTLGYTYGPISLMYIDMFYPTENKKGAIDMLPGTSGKMNYFRYKNEDLGDIHQQMAMVRFNGIKYFPIDVTVGVFTFGDPKLTKDPVKNTVTVDSYNAYSMLIDFGYAHKLKTGQKLSYNLSVTPYEGSGFFADGLNVVNLKFGVQQPVKVTDNYSFRLEGELVMNPYRENLYFVFGLGF